MFSSYITGDMKQLWHLYSTFFRIGAFTIGGGYVMLPVIQKEVVDVHGWATNEEVLDYYAIGQSTPGIIAINTATFVGFKTGGLPGAIAATAGMVSPSLIIIMTIAAFFSQFRENPIVQSAFKGAGAAVVALMVLTVVKMGKKVIKDRFGYFLALAAFAAVVLLPVSPIWIILAAAISGIIIRQGSLREKSVNGAGGDAA